MEWQPIETAPKNGTDILLVFIPDMGREMIVASYDDKYPGASPVHCWIACEGSAYHRDAVTHWMPLPEPPKP